MSLIQCTPLRVPFKPFQTISDGVDGFYLFNNRQNSIYHISSKLPHFSQIPHHFENALLFAFIDSHEALILKPYIFLSSTELLIISSRSLKVINTQTLKEITHRLIDRPWKFLHYNNIVVIVYQRRASLHLCIYKYENSTFTVKYSDFKDPTESDIPFPTINICSVNSTKLLTIRFSKGPRYVFDVDSKIDKIQEINAPDGIDNSTVISGIFTQFSAQQTFLHEAQFRIETEPFIISSTGFPTTATFSFFGSILVNYADFSIKLLSINTTSITSSIKSLSNSQISYPSLLRHLLRLNKESTALDILRYITTQPLKIVHDCFEIIPTTSLSLSTAITTILTHISSKQVRSISQEIALAIYPLDIPIDCQNMIISKLISEDDCYGISCLIQNHVVKDNSVMAILLCGCDNEILVMYGLDMLKRLKEYVADAVRNAKLYHIELDKTNVWKTLATLKDDSVQYQLQWFYME
ncbi:Mic1 domain-containing protein [Entamoeba marina]